ncbi:MAG: hypothetical protein HYU63_07440 [Armatimonadetes bacterium]|nr:hypothetical protein [Armatimonadota bacterium]
MEINRINGIDSPTTQPTKILVPQDTFAKSKLVSATVLNLSSLKKAANETSPAENEIKLECAIKSLFGVPIGGFLGIVSGAALGGFIAGPMGAWLDAGLGVIVGVAAGYSIAFNYCKNKKTY